MVREHDAHICNFITLYTQVFRDRNLSNAAKGLFGYMMTNNLEEWNYTQFGLSEETGDSIDRIRSQIKELETCGYVVKSRKRVNGQLKGADYELIEIPSNYMPNIKNPQIPKSKLQEIDETEIPF